MGVKINPTINEESEDHVCLGIVDPRRPFPGKIYAHAMYPGDPVLYVPRIFASAVVVMEDDDNIVGHCYCSKCKGSIDIFDSYCCHCGAKLKGRKVLEED